MRRLPFSSFSLLIPAVVVIGAIISLADHGFEQTDESYYLLLIRTPESGPAEPTFFGYFLAFLDRLGIAEMRIVNMLALAASFGGLAWVVGRACRQYLGCHALSLVSIGLLGGVACITRLPMTPSYNTLGAILSATAVTLAVAAVATARASGTLGNPVLLLAFAYGAVAPVAILVRPPLALLWVTLAMLVLSSHPDIRTKRVLIALAVSAVTGFVAGALMVHWFVVDLARRVVPTIEAALEKQGIWGDFEISMQSDFAPIIRTLQTMIAPAFATVITCLALALRFSTQARAKNVRVLLAMAIVSAPWLLFLHAVILSFRSSGISLNISPWGLDVLIYNLCLCMASAFVILRVANHTATPDKMFWIVSAMLFVAAFGCVVGTGNSLTGHAVTVGAGFLFLLAALPLSPMRSLIGDRFLGVAFTGIVAIQMLFLWSMVRNPYALNASLLAQTERVTFPNGKDTLLLDPARARYVRDLASVYPLVHGGEGPVPHLVDLTGVSPAANYVLDAPTIGVPWLTDVFVGSEDYAALLMTRLRQEELRRAWLLVPNSSGQHAIDLRVLKQAGLDFPAGYLPVLETRTGGAFDLEAVIYRPRTTGRGTEQ